MGDIMRDDDIYIPSMLELLNLRFAITPPERGVTDVNIVGGLEEMTQLQKEFTIFQQGRSLRESVAILNLGGSWNARVKSRWYELLDAVGKAESNVPGQNGNRATVDAIIADLGSSDPKPVYFAAHDARQDPRVMITPVSEPIFYIRQEYLTISFPMRPRRAGARGRAPARARPPRPRQR
jgi:hypothetical protein